MLQRYSFEFRVSDGDLQIQLAHVRIFVRFKDCGQVFELDLILVGNNQSVLDHGDCDVLVQIKRVVLEYLDLADYLDFVRLQFYDLVPAVGRTYVAFDCLFEHEETAYQTQALKSFFAGAFKEQLTLFVPDLNQMRTILKALQFGISDFDDYGAVEVELICAAS